MQKSILEMLTEEKSLDFCKRILIILVISLISIFIKIDLVYGIQCSDLLKSQNPNTMDFERISAALDRNHGVRLNSDYSDHQGVWIRSSRELGINTSAHSAKEVILAHEATHMTTDIKIENDPSIRNLARGVKFLVSQESESLNDFMGQEILRGSYQKYFRIDEVHAHWKSIIISEALAKQKKEKGEANWSEFIVFNTINKKLTLIFLEASRLLLERAIQQLEVSDRNSNITFTPRQSINSSESSFDFLVQFEELVKSGASLDDLSALQRETEQKSDVFDVSFDVTNAEGLPGMRLGLPIRWEGDVQNIPTGAIDTILEILYEAVAENNRLLKVVEGKELLSISDLISGAE